VGFCREEQITIGAFVIQLFVLVTPRSDEFIRPTVLRSSSLKSSPAEPCESRLIELQSGVRLDNLKFESSQVSGSSSKRAEFQISSLTPSPSLHFAAAASNGFERRAVRILLWFQS
jgi:hypothetical protein